MYEPPSELSGLFLENGWFPERKVKLPSLIPLDHPAYQVLQRYAGLTVGKCGDGLEVSTSDVEFRVPESDNPEEFVEKQLWEQLLKTQLISIAHVHRQHGELWVGSDGRFFGRSYIHDAMWLEGVTFSSAITTLLTGTRVKPMLRPDQNTISVYGAEYDRDSPETYRWEDY